MTDASEQRVRAEARVGTILHGKYRVDAVLGVGGMGAVYAVTHRNQKRFAVKVLHPELSLRADLKQRFVREGYVANSLNHTGAVGILDDDVAEDGAAFLVMELLDGVTVEQMWQGVPGLRVSPDAVVAIAHQTLDTLAAAHARSIVHRDVKPANLFLLRDGQVKVLDFGIARVKDATGANAATNTGALLGTPAFMAPEQAAGETNAIDGRTDVWAVGATMFALLTGEFVHVGHTGQQMVIQAATKPARPLATVRPDLPARLVAIVDRALAFDRTERWTAPEMRNALGEAYAGLFGVPLSRLPVAALVSRHPTPPPEPLGGGAARPAAPSTAPRRPSAPEVSFPTGDEMPLATTAQSVSKAAPRTRTVPPPWRARSALLASLALGATVLAALVVARSRLPAVPASVPTSAPPAGTSSPDATPAPLPSPAPATLAIAPATAVVEVDGARARVLDGGIDLPGAPGSMHLVHLVDGNREATFPVLLTPTGPVPREVELPAAKPEPTAPLRRGERPPHVAPPTAVSSPSAAPASSGAPTISRTME